MATEIKPSLAAQRSSICDQLRVQRQILAEQLSPSNTLQGGYPRSITMQFVIRRPTALAKVVGLLTGGRFADLALAIVVLAQLPLSGTPLKAQKSP
jgi:hypothetical protein